MPNAFRISALPLNMSLSHTDAFCQAALLYMSVVKALSCSRHLKRATEGNATLLFHPTSALEVPPDLHI